MRGYNIMKGYLNRPEATAEVLENGWFRTGDLARRDADGFYFIVDRAKDMIIRGGFNVYPREIEEALIRHPAVSLVAVIGVEHPSLGEDQSGGGVERDGRADRGRNADCLEPGAACGVQVSAYRRVRRAFADDQYR